ncbi:MAG TPA: endolytic transglycosylase MltG [Gaiellaceae bacterium]|nr:endolytic transglycosylase MltG [Gaiellaceae bacterium]
MRRLGVLLVLLATGASAAAAAPPKPALLGISFPEGFSSRQMVDRVAAVRRIAIRTRHVTPRLTAKAYAAALAKTPAPAAFRPYLHERSLEGFLFPSLYRFGPADTAAALVGLQLREFAKEWKRVGPITADANPYEVLTVASMVEREAAVASERPLVAAVIYNRLAQAIPLGIDATLRYGLGIPGTRPLTKAQLATDSPYNTRLHTGLPPTPISNPGLPSLRAAARPATTDDLYYVRIPDTVRHYFTADYADFCAHVTEYGYGSC